MEDKTHPNRITVRFSDVELLALISCATKLGFVDRNGKPKISTFIRRAIKSNRFYKSKLRLIKQNLKEKND